MGTANRKQYRAGLQHFVVDVPERRVVVQHVETAAEGRADEIVLTLLNDEVAERDIRHAASELGPLVAAIHGEEHAELRAEKQQLRVDVVLDDAPENVPIGQVRRDAPPAAAAVLAFQQVRRKVARLVVVDDDIDRVGIVQIRFDVIDEIGTRYARQRAGRAP